ncbi:MAG: amidohydrolase family protein [Acidobacteriota bacterium]|nr:amidohydrolase family protein [Acidobacteriota bacterium]
MKRLWAALGLWLTALVACGPGHPTGLLFDNATIVDGSGAAPFRADVLVRDGRIAEILASEQGQIQPDGLRRVDAEGLVLSPGFIDLHSHADLVLLADAPQRNGLIEAKLRQGVTTWIVGNCGLGVAPADPPTAALLESINSWMTPEGVQVGAIDTAGYLESLTSQQLPINVGTLVPHGPVRISAMGLRAGPPDAAELDAMRRQIQRGLRAGAFGVSTGLIYPPGMYSDPAELQALAAEVAESDGLWTTHVRGSSETLLPATEELIELARVTGVRVHHSHLEAVGTRFWPQIDGVLGLEDRAREEGLSVSHDLFLYTRAATMMSAIFPPWALEGGMPRLLERLRDRETRRRIGSELQHRVPQWPPWEAHGWPHNLVEAVGWDGIYVASLAARQDDPRIGKSLAALGQELQQDPFDVVADLMLEFDGGVGQWVGEISGDDEQHAGLQTILRHPSSAIVSDAEDYGTGVPHPAHAGAFVRALRWAREGKGPSLPVTVRKMTTYPAELLGLPDRGQIRVGHVADLVLFDPDTVGDRSEWLRPRRHAAGIAMVLVGGHAVVDGGLYSPEARGQVLRRPTR